MNKLKWKDAINDPPEVSTWALVYADGAMACRAWNPERECWEDWQGCTTSVLIMTDITHWMPLPEAPEVPDTLPLGSLRDNCFKSLYWLYRAAVAPVAADVNANVKAYITALEQQGVINNATICPDCRGLCGRYDPSVGQYGMFYPCV